MIKLKDLLVERINYYDTASQLIKAYNLESKVKFSSTFPNRAEYNWKTNIFHLSNNYSSIKEFIVTVLHEIHHATQQKELGTEKWARSYTVAGELVQQQGKDFYEDNPFELEAEQWAISEYNKKWKEK